MDIQRPPRPNRRPYVYAGMVASLVGRDGWLRPPEARRAHGRARHALDRHGVARPDASRGAGHRNPGSRADALDLGGHGGSDRAHPRHENAELFELSNPDVQPGLAFHEANTLSETLREQRLGALEATALLQRVMEEIDVAVFAFDSEQRLKLVNRAGERLLGRPAENLVGRSADELALREALTGEAPRVFDESFPGGAGRWEVRRSEFRQGGTPHRLLVLADLSRTLREEERTAWQRLVRVLSHEINNSLAPIKSSSGPVPARPGPGMGDLLPLPESRKACRAGCRGARAPSSWKATSRPASASSRRGPNR